MWEETSGNPFFVGEVLRHLAESGAIVERDGAWTSDLGPGDVGIPEGIREVVGRRLTRLRAHVERILSTAAVVGLEFGVDLVADVLGDDVDDVLDGLEEAGRAALVDEVSADRWRFAHAIVRETLLAELSSTRRVRQHRKVATALEARHAGDLDEVVNQLAHHWGEAAAGGADVDTAVSWATRAGDKAMAKAAVADAARWYEQAVGLVDPDEPEGAALCDLLVKLASGPDAERRRGVPGDDAAGRRPRPGPRRPRTPHRSPGGHAALRLSQDADSGAPRADRAARGRAGGGGSR